MYFGYVSVLHRYVDPVDNLPREDLIEFIECDTGITGEALAGKILECLHDYKVDMTKARGQAYQSINQSIKLL